MPLALVVDDKDSMRSAAAEVLRETGFTVDEAGDGEEALKRLSGHAYDLLLTDLKMPRRNGMELLAEARKVSPDLVVLLMTAYGTVEDAVEAMKLGAADFLQKPFSMDELAVRVRRAMEQIALVRENRLLKETSGFEFTGVVGASPAMREVYDTIRKVAATPSTVLVTGESGTGKELVARAIHLGSDRRERPFVAVNCAALNEGVLESELFGHEKGAFTGALAQRVGRFELASGGTLFLDEVGEVPQAIQVKLLRVLQEREIQRVGSSHNVRVDVRLVAATNRDLEEGVAKGSFRKDLFYRLNVVPLKLPPLRERREDLPVLAKHFLEKFARESGKKTSGFTDAAILAMNAYGWPGNVRELENVIERAVVLSEGGAIDVSDLPYEARAMGAVAAEGTARSAPGSLEERVALYERKLIVEAMESAAWNQSRAAELLKMARPTLQRRIALYALHPPGKGAGRV